MIYLTQHSVAYTENTELITGISTPQHAHYFPEIYQKLKTGLFYVPHRLAEKVLDPKITSYLKQTPVDKAAFILAAGNLVSISGEMSPGPENIFKYTYKIPHFTIAQIYAARIAQKLGVQDLVLSDSNACASSLKVLTDVWNLIKYQNFDRVVVLAIEDGLSNSMLEFFGANQASLSYEQEQKLNVKPSAFDNKNFGFYLGQGAVLTVFESEKTVKHSHINPKAKLLGAGIGSEHSTNAIGQNETGQGYKNAIQMALNSGEINKKDIKIVKTHGTGTPTNNKSEKTALLSELKDFIATSYKQRIGHTLGVSGLLETCILLNDIKQGVIPEIKNRTEEDDTFISKPSTVPDSSLILSLASGMGNIYSAAVFKHLDD
jgi:3-oxoacyl-(acyl-carrier-protein) synthase